MNKNFKPMLAPNDRPGANIDWAKRLGCVSNWMFSEKLNGIRLELDMKNGIAYSRALKPFRNKYIQKLATEIADIFEPTNIEVLEAEIYAPGLNLEEIKHFVTSIDVTTKASRTKFKRELENGKWPGRDLDWLCTYPKELKFFVFDVWIDNMVLDKETRYNYLKRIMKRYTHPKLELIKQWQTNDLFFITEKYKDIVSRGGEGLMLFRRKSLYKTNRYTNKQNQAYKMKDNSNEYEGVIIDIEEGTVVDPDAPKTTNELGYSVTSNKKEDRLPSGMAKGFTVRMDDGKELIVRLKNCDNSQKTWLLENYEDYIGERINFVAMKPSKVGGVPSQAIFDFNNFTG